MITNVVCTADLNTHIDLRTAVNKCINVVYDPSSFSGLRWNHPEIGGHCALFSNGKLMVNGKARSVRAAKLTVRRYARAIQRMGWPVKMTRVNVCTISAFFRLKQPLDLTKVVHHFSGRYEPELFPAAMFTKDSIHFTCFHSGSVVMTGIKRENQLYAVCMPVLIELYIL